jgi:glucose-6-phosphate isomerase
VLDTVDPEVVREHLAWRERVGARVLVVSKSGTTIEVQRILDVLFDAGLDHVVFVADPVRTPMDRRFSELGCSVDRFDMPADVGGRYSVLTAVGQVPLRCAGLDPHALLDGAASLRDSWIAEATTSEASESASVPDASRIGDLEALTQAITFRLAFPAAVHVAWCYAERLLPYAAWLQQLDNESLGRHRSDGDHVGEILLPLRGPADQHSVAQLLLDGPRDKRVFFVDRREGGLDHTSDEEQQGALLGSGYGRALRRVESLRAARPAWQGIAGLGGRVPAWNARGRRPRRCHGHRPLRATGGRGHQAPHSRGLSQTPASRGLVPSWPPAGDPWVKDRGPGTTRRACVRLSEIEQASRVCTRRGRPT